MKQFLLILLAGCFLGTSMSHAAPIELRAEQGVTKFVAIGKPAMLKIAGEGQGPSGNLKLDGKKISGEISVNLSSLKTGIDLRDDHMKNKFLQVGTFPSASLKIDSLELPKTPAETVSKIEGLNFKGILSLHGVNKPVEGKFEVEPDGKNLIVKAHYSLLLSDYSIEIPSYAGLKVADKVDVDVEFKVNK